MKRVLTILATLVAPLSGGAVWAGDSPAVTLDRLTALLAADYEGQVAVVYCMASFDSDGETDLAFATVSTGRPAGAYFVTMGGRLVELAPHSVASPDLQCLGAREAEELDQAIKASEGIHGGITGSGAGSDICGFVEDTRAVCWGYDDATGSAVVVGGWII